MRQRFAIILCCDNDETERNFGQVILMIFAKGHRPVIKSFNKHEENVQIIHFIVPFSSSSYEQL